MVDIEYWHEFEFTSGESALSAATAALGEVGDKVARIQTLTPHLPAKARPNSLSSRFGLGTHPPHTDGAHMSQPPRYLVFWMDRPDKSHTPTVLRKFDLQYLESDFISALARSIWLVRIRSNLHIYVKPLAPAVPSIVWDPGCFVRDVTGALTRQFVEDRFSELPSFAFEWTVGRGLIVNNRRTLHSRAPVKHIEQYTQRYLNRATVA